MGGGVLRARRVFAAVMIALVSIGTASPQTPPRPSPDADARLDRIVGAAMARGGAHELLRRLTDSIGGRVTGSPECRAAADLLLETLRAAGFEDARHEEYPIESRWRRGRALGRVVSPVSRS